MTAHEPRTVRLLGREDRDEWLRMLAGLYPDSIDDDHVPSVDAYIDETPIFELIPAAVFVAEGPAGGLCGFLELSIREYAEGCTGPTPYIESWFVDADVRGTGVGRALVKAAEEWARERGYREMASDAVLDNDASHRAHRAVGFEEVERIVVFRKGL